MLSSGMTTVQNLVNDDALVSVLDGRRRLIATASVYDRMVANIVRTNPADGARKKLHRFYGKRPHELKAKAS